MWIDYLPPSELQHSNIADSFGCVSFSAIHCIESQELEQTGQTPGYSERALAKLSGTYENIKKGIKGNDVQTVFNTIQKYGLILDSDWPTEIGDNWTLDVFYTDIPPEVLLKAVKPKISLLNGSTNLSLAPIWTALLLGGTQGHMVEALNQIMYFDSYEKFVKQFSSSDTITWQGQIILNPKSKGTLVFFKATNLPTIWTLISGQWVGFSDLKALNKYIDGRLNVTINLDQTEFVKLPNNPSVFKS